MTEQCFQNLPHYIGILPFFVFLDFTHLYDPGQMPIRTMLDLLGFVLGFHSHYVQQIPNIFLHFTGTCHILTNMLIAHHSTAGELDTTS